MPLFTDDIERLIGRLEDLQRRVQPAVESLSRPRHPSQGHAGSNGKFHAARLKPWYRTKTYWVGAVLCATGIGELLAGSNPGTSMAHFAEGAGLIALRQAIADLRLRH